MLKLKKSLALVAAGLMLAAPAFAVSPVDATYKASYMGMNATGKMQVASIGGGKYKTTLSVHNQLGFSSQVTVFDENGGNLRPLSSVDNSKFMGKKIDSTATYNWASGTASWDGNISQDKKGPAKMSAGDMDALLVNLAVVRDVAAGRSMNYRMLENGKSKNVTYRVVGKENINVLGKQQSATKVAGSGVTMWVVSGIEVPVRIEKKNDLGNIVMQLSSIN